MMIMKKERTLSRKMITLIKSFPNSRETPTSFSQTEISEKSKPSSMLKSDHPQPSQA